MTSTLFRVIGIISVVVYVIRYTLLYQNRLQLVERQLLKVIRTLDNVDDPTNHVDINLKRMGTIFRSVNEKLYRPDLMKNTVYKRIYLEYESLEDYRERFWRYEGPVYIAIISLSFIAFLLVN